jgi:pre-mRNA-processing factor 17
MSALVAGYDSSDDETPVASSSRTLPSLNNGFDSHTPRKSAQPQEDEEDDEEAIEKAARVDAFGLETSQNASDGQDSFRGENEKRSNQIMAAPDVLKEVNHFAGGCGGCTDNLVWQDPNGAGMAIIARPTDKVMNVNITYQDMTRAVAGPEDPFNQKKNKGMNTLSGESIFSLDMDYLE